MDKSFRSRAIDLARPMILVSWSRALILGTVVVLTVILMTWCSSALTSTLLDARLMDDCMIDDWFMMIGWLFVVGVWFEEETVFSAHPTTHSHACDRKKRTTMSGKKKRSSISRGCEAQWVMLRGVECVVVAQRPTAKRHVCRNISEKSRGRNAPQLILVKALGQELVHKDHISDAEAVMKTL